MKLLSCDKFQGLARAIARLEYRIYCKLPQVTEKNSNATKWKAKIP